MDALLQSALHGIPGTAMPPKGTCAPCSEEELKAAVEYMVSEVR
jgi:cytochrome c5